MRPPERRRRPAREGLRKLHSDYQAAASNRDRAARVLIADGYGRVQGNGSITTKAKHIENIRVNFPVLDADAVFRSTDRLRGYGDTRATEIKSGLFATTVFARIDGRWQFAHTQGTLLPPERKAVQLDPKALDAFAGSYEFGPGTVATATKEGDALMWKGGRRPKVRLTPLSETRFFVEESGVEMTFRKGDNGQVTGVTLRIGSCQDSEAKKVE